MNIQSEEKVVQIPISQIRDFPDHPYKVKDDESMNELVDSIMQRGLIQPVIIRPTEDGNYEMVSGHRRKRAFEIAGIKNIPARVKEMTKDEAILAMVDSNLQREVILPSEKAFAYKMRLEAMKRQAGRPAKDNSDPTGPNLIGTRSNTELAQEVNESETQIKRYIRLTNLIPELLELVD
ncbi:ParB/RepB/Spo0J family partition protein, partial [bacterium]|nr:ParB/RepB/Spo0J family partition protein [bacterium]